MQMRTKGIKCGQKDKMRMRTKRIKCGLFHCPNTEFVISETQFIDLVHDKFQLEFQPLAENAL